MKLIMLHKDDKSGGNGCPSIYLAENGDVVVQGCVVDGDTFAELVNVLPGESAVQITPDILLGAAERLRAADGER